MAHFNPFANVQISQDLQLGCLPGDSPYPYLANDNGCLSLAPHHDDWECVEWQEADDDVHRRAIYKDVVILAIRPNWLLMEPAQHLFFDCRESLEDEVIPNAVSDDDGDSDDPDSGSSRGRSGCDNSARDRDLGEGVKDEGLGDGSGGGGGSHVDGIGHEGGNVRVVMSSLFVFYYLEEFNAGGQQMGQGLDSHFLGTHATSSSRGVVPQYSEADFQAAQRDFRREEATRRFTADQQIPSGSGQSSSSFRLPDIPDVILFLSGGQLMAYRVQSVVTLNRYLFSGPPDDELVDDPWGDVRRVYAKAFDVCNSQLFE
ncbi:hypothetical protein LguiB_032014 [Lonicera macranthoides]